MLDSELGNLDDAFGNSTTPPASRKQQVESAKYFDLKGPTNDYRIMPPMFSLKESQRWAQIYSRHWGFKNANGKNQPWMCLYKQDYKTKEVKQRCPFCDHDEEALNRFKRAQRNLEELKETRATYTAETPAKLVQELDAKIEIHEVLLEEAQEGYKAPERKFWVNAMNREGEFGLLGLPKTVYEQIAGKLEKNNTRTPGLISKLLQENEIDALDVNDGVWIRISKSGSGRFDTKYQASYVTETITTQGANGKVVRSQAPMSAPLSDEQKRKALEKCRDLGHVFDHSILTPEQAELVIAGTPEAATALGNRPLTVAPPVQTKRVDDNFGTPRQAPIPTSSITKNFENVDMDAVTPAQMREMFRTKPI